MAKKAEMPEPELWERQENESTRAFEAFCAYRDLGPNRSIAKTVRKLGKNITTLTEWSSKFEWVKRATAWDDEQDRIARQQQLDEIVKMRKRHAQIAAKALEKVAEALESINSKEMSNADMTRFMDVASKLERISRGDVGDVIEERDGGEAVNPVQIYIPDNNRGRGKDNFDDLEV